MSISRTQLVCAVRGPLMLITLGTLFLLDYFGPGWYPFYKTFPVLLIVFGVLKLIERLVAQSEAGEAPARGQQ